MPVPYPGYMGSRRVLLVAALAGAAGIAAAVFLPHSPQGLRDLVLGAGVAAPLIALGAWLLLTPAMVSGTLLAAAGGLAFGAAEGALISVAGAVLGGMAAFGVARCAARTGAGPAFRSRGRLAKLEDLLERRGFQAVLAARLMPGVPATALHYAAGASRVRPRAFAGAIAIGALLRTTPYALLGQGVGSGSLAALLVAGASIAVGAAAAAALLRRVRRMPLPA